MRGSEGARARASYPHVVLAEIDLLRLSRISHQLCGAIGTRHYHDHHYHHQYNDPNKSLSLSLAAVRNARAIASRECTRGGSRVAAYVPRRVIKNCLSAGRYETALVGSPFILSYEPTKRASECREPESQSDHDSDLLDGFVVRATRTYQAHVGHLFTNRSPARTNYTQRTQVQRPRSEIEAPRLVCV